MHESVIWPSDIFKGVKEIANNIESFLAPMSGHYDLRNQHVLRCIFSLEDQVKPTLKKEKYFDMDV